MTMVLLPALGLRSVLFCEREPSVCTLGEQARKKKNEKLQHKYTVDTARATG